MIHIRYEAPLVSYNTFGIPATASVFAESDNAAELAAFVRSLPDLSSVFLLGGGSNVLFVSDRCETVIRPVMKEIEQTGETDDTVWVRVGAGVVWDDFVNWCMEKNYAGVENLSYIPGTVGACPVQNIGAYGVEAQETIKTVEAVDLSTGQAVIFNREQCMFDYRDSFFKSSGVKYLITHVCFGLSKKFEPNIEYAGLKTELPRNEPVTVKTVRQAVIRIRTRKLPDPAVLGNAGSFFKNPVVDAAKSEEIGRTYPQAPLYPASDGQWKIPAAWLVQQCGWKGARTGNVGVHERQPLVIVNYGGATGREILDLAKKIIATVEGSFGISLEPEVNIV